MMPEWAGVPAAFLLGSIPFGYLIVRMGRGRDVRTEGSGNIGAANVARTSGTVAGVLTLALDAAKGFLAVWLAARWSEHAVVWIATAAVAAVLGHMFTPWLRFNGGKGVATGVGVFAGISPAAVLAAIVVWVVVVAFCRYVSLGSIVAAAALPLLVYFLYAPPERPPWILSLAATLTAILIIWKHRTNLQRLMAGDENKLKLGQ